MKNKKKLFAVLAAVLLIAIVGVGSTIAYLTDKEEIPNTLTVGHVDITLTETQVEKDSTGKEYIQTTEITDKGLTFGEVLPGQTVPKNPTITVTEDSADAYVRAKLEVTAPDGSKITEADLKVLEDALIAQIKADDDWYYNETDGYFYYQSVRKATETAVLFKTVTIPGEEWAANTAGQTFNIKVYAEAIQADYFTPATTEGKISGWLGSTGEPIDVMGYNK